MKTFIRRHTRAILISISLLITILVGILVGVILVYQKGFPQIENLEDIQPIVMTSIFDDQNQVIKEFAIEKRIIVKHSDIPDVLKKALVAAEDNQFYSHWGINFRGLLRAIVGIIIHQRLDPRWGGGSSITQQLARGLFLTPKVSFSRKFQEILLSIQIERRYTKDQIMTFYCNKIFLGGPVWGMGSASRYYFGVPINNLTTAQAATLAGIIPSANNLYDVFKRPGNTLRRRNSILKRMLEFEFISEDQYREAIKEQLPSRNFSTTGGDIGDYFLEETRKYLEAQYGDNLLYKGGLKVYTTLNSEMQTWAEKALKEGLREVDKRRGWRPDEPRLNLIDKDLDLHDYVLPSWKRASFEPDGIVEGVVLTANSQRARVRISGYGGQLDAENTKWAKVTPNQLFKTGDVGLFRILKLNNETMEMVLSLEQEPEVEGGIVVIDNKTGAIKALVGGYDYRKKQYNWVTQALRQTGSTIKPIIYTAALENGYTPASEMTDEPFTFYDSYLDEIWEPQNDQGNFKGPITLRRGFEQSRNVVTARLVDAITPQMVVNYCRKFGISSELKPYMSIALGAFEITLKEMVAAYSVFPNAGMRVDPYFIKTIRNRSNNIVEENVPQKRQVISPDVAFIMNYLMQGVTSVTGTGWRVAPLKEKSPIGGKTGTTDDYTNAWFIGFSPTITVGVLVGLDPPQEIGEQETGSRAASPVFLKFMEKYLDKYEEPKQFRKPAGVLWVDIDKFTGLLLGEECLYPFREAFIRGSEPSNDCNEDAHARIIDYQPDIRQDGN